MIDEAIAQSRREPPVDSDPLDLDDGLTKWGFIVGPVEVRRVSTLPSGEVHIEVRTGHDAITVRASPKGEVLEVIKDA